MDKIRHARFLKTLGSTTQTRKCFTGIPGLFCMAVLMLGAGGGWWAPVGRAESGPQDDTPQTADANDLTPNERGDIVRAIEFQGNQHYKDN